jgi:hypothetical protein
MLLAEVKLMDDMACIQVIQNPLYLHLHVVIEISMTTDVKVARNFFHSESAYHPAAVLIFYGFSHILKLPMRILLPQ